jgi:hypothetical protein
LRSDTITSVLQLATRADLDADERLARLDDIRAELTDHTALQPAFIKPLIETAARVIRKELTKVAAQKYLASLKER